jgi:hypothetical protein
MNKLSLFIVLAILLVPFLLVQATTSVQSKIQFEGGKFLNVSLNENAVLTREFSCDLKMSDITFHKMSAETFDKLLKDQRVSHEVCMVLVDEQGKSFILGGVSSKRTIDPDERYFHGTPDSYGISTSTVIEPGKYKLIISSLFGVEANEPFIVTDTVTRHFTLKE